MCKDSEPKRGMERCLEAVWQTEQKLYPKTRQASKSPGASRVGGWGWGVALASKYLSPLQVLYFMCPPPRDASWTQVSGSAWKAGDFWPECSKANAFRIRCQVILSFESHEFRLGPVPSSPFLFCGCPRGGPGRLTPLLGAYQRSLSSSPKNI